MLMLSLKPPNLLFHSQFPVIHPVNLKKKDFHYPYRAPEAHKAGQKRTPEEVELEIKNMEENMEKMVLVNVEYVHT